MDIQNFIKKCADEKIELSIVDGKLSINVIAPPTDKSLLLQLKHSRQDIESYLIDHSEKVVKNGAADRLSMSLFYFSSDEGSRDRDKYRLLIEGTKFADSHGFEAVWTPERHFAQFGGLYPNPSLMAAALATITENVSLRAGSVVLPLNDPLRVAEEWSVVDNLSNGRIGIAFASGWQPNDFVLSPDTYETRHQYMYDGLDQIKKLWQGKSITRRNGVGEEIGVGCLPRPVQSELPVWITAASNPGTFETAGKLGANILTHLTGQTVETLAEKIALYKRARRESGFTTPGRVTLMIHTFISSNQQEVLQTAKEPFKRYLSQSIGLLDNLARQAGIVLEKIGEKDMQALLEHAFHRYHESSALLGTPETALALISKLKAVGVNEIACLIDFGIDIDLVIDNFVHLNELKEAVVAL